MGSTKKTTKQGEAKASETEGPAIERKVSRTKHGGRTRANESLIHLIVSCFRVGMPKRRVAAAAGISVEQLNTLLRNSERSPSGSPDRRLYDALVSAKAHTEREALETILLSANKDFRAAAWWLEKVVKEEYDTSKKIELQIQEGLQNLLMAVRPLMQVEAYNELIQAIAVVQGLAPDTASGQDDVKALPGSGSGLYDSD